MIKYSAVTATGHSEAQLSESIRHYTAKGYICDGNTQTARLSTGKMEYTQEMMSPSHAKLMEQSRTHTPTF